MKCITTFPQDAPYAETCVKSLIKSWPGPVTVYFEGCLPPSYGQAGSRPLDEIEKREWFLELDTPKPANYLWDSKRFCHKSFAIIDAVNREPFFYVDADVLWTEEIPEKLVKELVKDAAVTYLGRENNYTETGLLGFNPTHPEFAKFFRRFEEMYTDGLLFKLQAWTDCHAFDFSKQGITGRNLTPQGRGVDDVFAQSVFGQYGDHLKGPRKREVA